MKKILLDENLPEQLKNLLAPDFDIFTVGEMGWSSLVNGEWLRAMVAEGFEVLLTADKNLPFQQNLTKYPLQVAVIRSFDHRFKTLAPMIEYVRDALMIMPSHEKVVAIDLRK
jgi:hypothetical protein